MTYEQSKEWAWKQSGGNSDIYHLILVALHNGRNFGLEEAAKIYQETAHLIRHLKGTWPKDVK